MGLTANAAVESMQPGKVSAVERLRSAGAIILGKTGTTEYAIARLRRRHQLLA